MANIGVEHIKHLVDGKTRMQNYVDKFKKRIAGVTQKSTRTLEVAAAAGIGGLIQGRAGEEGSHILHIPTDLAAGLGLNILGYFNAAGKHSDHLNNLGDGFLASFVSGMTFEWGDAWRRTGKFQFSLHGKHPHELAPGTAVKGEIPAAQMADIVARVHAAANRSPG